MKDKKQWRRRLLITGTVIALLAYGGIDHVYTPQYEILEEQSKAFARYSKGLVYIGSQAFLDSLKDIQPGDVLVLDERRDKDPSMKIYSSAKIENLDERNEILEILCRYEECDPTDWDRTIESMRLEWLLHNWSYYLNHKKHRTEDVDLNNKDEEVYDILFLNKILKI